MQPSNVKVTFEGANLGEVITHAKNFLSVADQIAGAGAVSAGPQVPVETTTKRTRKAAAAPAAPAQTEMFGAEPEAADDFMNPPEETTTISAKTVAKKLTEKDVNDACIAHAKIHTKPVTLGILSKKFNVKSVLELKPEQYPAVVDALKV